MFAKGFSKSFHSYLKATTGFNFEAWNAGKVPKKEPITNENKSAPIIRAGLILAAIRSEPSASLPTNATPVAPKKPIVAPIIPPTVPNKPDSIKKIVKTIEFYLEKFRISQKETVIVDNA